MVSQMVLGSDLRRGNSGRGHGPGRRLAAWSAAVILSGALALTSCGDDDGGNGTAPTTPSEETTSAEPSPTAPDDPAAAEREIKQNWQRFFDPAVPLKDKQDLLENGDKLGPVLQGFSGDERGRQVRAEVNKVEFTSPTEANVTYTLTLKGATVMPDAAGTAVEQGGVWKVSVKTLCGLVGLSGNESPAPGC
ncbi:hypothetical protein FE633_38815 [Streptomyces montanus]|uniref:Low molecular weight antigen MTB12-like C-terminal domain-containing protein n=2 Tax=Streptomyces montanus TaxID=2580423 RepID=A0A5R9FB14_9ACTN|nr:hypothetical protein FE633_38815 [Streptomyces montanus]